MIILCSSLFCDNIFAVWWELNRFKHHKETADWYTHISKVVHGAVPWQLLSGSQTLLWNCTIVVCQIPNLRYVHWQDCRSTTKLFVLMSTMSLKDPQYLHKGKHGTMKQIFDFIWMKKMMRSMKKTITGVPSHKDLQWFVCLWLNPKITKAMF